MWGWRLECWGCEVRLGLERGGLALRGWRHASGVVKAGEDERIRGREGLGTRGEQSRGKISEELGSGESTGRRGGRATGGELGN